MTSITNNMPKNIVQAAVAAYIWCYANSPDHPVSSDEASIQGNLTDEQFGTVHQLLNDWLKRSRDQDDFEFHEEMFKLMPSVPKKEVMKVHGGDLVLVKWADSAPMRCLLLEKPTNEAGDVSLMLWSPETRNLNTFAVHSQVVVIGPAVAVPEMID